MKKELLQKLAATVAPLSDAELERVAGGRDSRLKPGDIITSTGGPVQYTPSTSGGQYDDCQDAIPL